MYKIGICDDEKSTCAEIEKFIYEYANVKNIKMRVEVWYSGKKLCNYLEENNKLDIIFLDIELMEMNGVEVGNYIRNELEDYSTYIIFISSKTNYALSLFKVHPLDFLIKPIGSDQTGEILDRAVHLLKKENLFFEFVNANSCCRVMYEEIEYFYSDKRKIIIVTKNSRLEFYGKLELLLPDMPPNFIMIHKSCIINRNYISEYSYELIKMYNGDNVTVSRSNRKLVREKILAYHRERKTKDV